MREGCGVGGGAVVLTFQELDDYLKLFSVPQN